MRFSINVTHYSWPTAAAGIPAALDRVVRAADEAGVDTVWVPDHLLQCDPDSTPEAEMLEAYTTLGLLAARTARVRLGTMVTDRPPALLAKAVTTLDVLSGGRAWLGIGADHHRGEADAMGLSMPPVAERFERLEDTLHLTRQMWAGDDAAFNGVHCQLGRPVSSPRPVRRPAILIGGMGERRTLRLVAATGRRATSSTSRRRPHGPPEARRPRPPLRGGGQADAGDRQDVEHPSRSGRDRARVRPALRGCRRGRDRARGGPHRPPVERGHRGCPSELPSPPWARREQQWGLSRGTARQRRARAAARGKRAQGRAGGAHRRGRGVDRWLLINIVFVALVPLALRPTVSEAADYGRRLAAGQPVADAVHALGDLIYPPIVSPVGLLIAVLLAVYKPWGRIRDVRS